MAQEKLSTDRYAGQGYHSKWSFTPTKLITVDATSIYKHTFPTEAQGAITNRQGKIAVLGFVNMNIGEGTTSDLAGNFVFTLKINGVAKATFTKTYAAVPLFFTQDLRVNGVGIEIAPGDVLTIDVTVPATGTATTGYKVQFEFDIETFGFVS